MVDVSQHDEDAPQHPGAGEAPNWRWIAHVLDWYAGNAPDSVHRASAARQAALVRGRADMATPPSAPVGEVVDYQRALDLIGDAYNAGTHGIGYSQQAADLFDARAAAPSAPAAQGGGDADDGMADASVWTLIALMERVGGERDSGEEGSFITMTLDQVYALEALLTARGHDPGWVDAAPPSAPVGVAEALRIAYRHLDMVSMRVSHRKDAAAIESALAQQPAPSAPVGVEGLVANAISQGKRLQWPAVMDTLERLRGTLALAQQPAAEAQPVGVEKLHARADDIESAIATGRMNAMQAFTQMRQLLPNRAALAQQPAAVDEAMVKRVAKARGEILSAAYKHIGTPRRVLLDAVNRIDVALAAQQGGES